MSVPRMQSSHSGGLLLSGAPSVAFTRGGVKQIVSALEAVTLGNGGASDSTP